MGVRLGLVCHLIGEARNRRLVVDVYQDELESCALRELDRALQAPRVARRAFNRDEHAVQLCRQLRVRRHDDDRSGDAVRETERKVAGVSAARPTARADDYGDDVVGVRSPFSRTCTA